MANDTTTGFRLSAEQERVWEQQGDTPYLAQCTVLLEGALQVEILQQAVAKVMGQQEILRTAYIRRPGLKVPFQVILDHASPNWEFVDLTGMDSASQASAIQSLLETAPALNLEEGRLLYLRLIALSQNKHQLILILPTLSADTRSLRNFVDEIGKNYAALLTGVDHDAELMQYVDIVQWQADLLESEEGKAGRKYWRERSREFDANDLNSISLPFENPSPATVLPSQIYSVDLRPEVNTQVQQLGTESRDLLLACWAILIGRLSGRTNVVIGCALDGRRYEELETALGLFAKDVPLLIEVQPDFSCNTVLRQTKNSFTEANQWQDGFTWADLAGAESDSPSLPFALEFIELASAQQFGDLSFRMMYQSARRGCHKLKLSVVHTGTSLTLEFHYDDARLSGETVRNFAGYYQTLLAAALKNPEAEAGSLPLLSETEHTRIAIEWNATAVSYSSQCIQEMFEFQAAAVPDRDAVRCGDRCLTYRELNQRSNQLAHHLRQLGVGPDSLVGLCIDRSVTLMVGVLAILKAGAAYVPLSADNPKPRLAQQLTGASLLLTEENLLAQMPGDITNTLCLDTQEALWQHQPVSNPQLQTTLENLAYVLYTSGSTGVPKGVAVRHRNLVNYSRFITTRLQLDRYSEGLHFATVSTIAADLGNTCIYPALISGGCLHVIPYEIATDTKSLAAYCSRYPIDVLKIVPSHLHTLLLAPEAAHLLPRRYLVTGGEALTSRLVSTIAALQPSCEVLNHYGPTETTVGSLTLFLRDFDWQSASSASIPIGRPIANTQVYILDAYRQLVPPGVAGELYIAGDGVTAGYLNDPTRTAERFVPNPFSAHSNAAMYRTGDLARYLPDGNVEFIGRVDDQVKIRGFRIELGEIEAILAGNSAVNRAVVLARENKGGERRILGYVVLNSGGTTTSEDLRSYLKEQLPDYMVPAAIVTLPKLPLSANGKIDRSALPEPELVAQTTYIAPRTPTEEVVASIWAEVLKRDRVSAFDNFFDLGGHSLLATQVISRIRRILNVDVPLRSLFETPTVAAIAGNVDAARRDPNIGQVPPITRASRDRPLPLSFAQQRLWVLDQIEPNNPLYNIPRRVRLRGTLDVESLAKALNAVVQRHESQRTIFAVQDGQPVQKIVAALALDLAQHDLSQSSEADRLDEARRIAADEGVIPFDLAAGPLLRASLLKLAADDHILLLTMHHIVSDAWSAGVFFQEFSELYDTFSGGTTSSLLELEIQYADYATWQRSWLQGEVLSHQLAYWREQLRGAPQVLQLTSDRPRAKQQSFRGSHETILFSGETAKALRKLGQQEGATLFMTLLAGFQSLLMRYTGQDQIVVGTDVANRPTTETERLIGFFINLLALRTDLSGNPTFRELLARVREVALGAYAHQDMPFDKLVEELQPERSLSHNPLVQVLFVMQNLPRQRRELNGLRIEPFELPITRSKFDLAVFVVDGDQALTCYWLYSTDLFDKTTIERMALHFEQLLASAAANPDTRINALEMLSESELKEKDAAAKEKQQTQRKKLMTAAPKAISLPEA